ncbi:TPM domain-containing protein [Dasania sp. GY-MA-18]|uniref:TPM domain-containing protein n=1 Tax=Dasania phycosphaerae TaxID=2950436 RepID=A0A9J6RJX4_9GAMM|nr:MULTISPECIES: TPM domain-containing protein [Dasania]MCR8922351.1 TPM domain-containing protein [Dasania sp. GY-MA-18]MCZ0864779.1 TPM domain-containing protein [Dasania phycosphaerae]MCZ0868507.1 TPM domain-containing protein [Dasania phycosphaerae]
MKALNEQQLAQISAAIQQVEQQTDAELVTVLAKQADNYYYIPTLWAALLALLVPVLLRFTPLWLDGIDLLKAQWLTFACAALVFRIPFIKMRLVPKSVQQWRASSLARRQFLDNNLHHTKGETGVLVFVSEAEHYVEILADRGIAQQVDDKQWQQIIDAFTAQVKAGNTQQGFISCIEQCGALLKQYAPATAEKNELPNHLVLL